MDSSLNRAIAFVSLAMIKILLILVSCICGSKTGSFYMVTDKPVVTYKDADFFPALNLSSVRYGRLSDMYYANLHLEVAYDLDNNLTVEIVFYEAVYNQYRRSFIEMQFKFCNFFFEDPIFGAALRRQTTFKACPIPKGTYHFYNMTASADHLPAMPFTRGRIKIIFAFKKKAVLKGYCDLELKRKKN